MSDQTEAKQGTKQVEAAQAAKPEEKSQDYALVAGQTAIYHDRDLTSFEAETFNVLTPTTYLIEEGNGYQIVVTGVRIDPDLDGEDVYSPPNARRGALAFRKSALVKLMHAAGLQFIPEHTGRQDNGGNPKYVDFKVSAKMRTPTGGWTEVTASKSIHLDNVERDLRVQAKKKDRDEDWVQAELARIANDMPRLAETKAMNAMIRVALNIQQTYTKDELAKPFIVPRIEYTPHKANGGATGVVNRHLANVQAALRELDDEADPKEKAKLEAQADILKRVRDDLNGEDQYAVATRGSKDLYGDEDKDAVTWLDGLKSSAGADGKASEPRPVKSKPATVETVQPEPVKLYPCATEDCDGKTVEEGGHCKACRLKRAKAKEEKKAAPEAHWSEDNDRLEKYFKQAEEATDYSRRECVTRLGINDMREWEGSPEAAIARLKEVKALDTPKDKEPVRKADFYIQAQEWGIPKKYADQACEQFEKSAGDNGLDWSLAIEGLKFMTRRDQLTRLWVDVNEAHKKTAGERAWKKAYPLSDGRHVLREIEGGKIVLTQKGKEKPAAEIGKRKKDNGWYLLMADDVKPALKAWVNEVYADLPEKIEAADEDVPF